MKEKKHLGRVFPVIDEFGMPGENECCVCTGVRDSKRRLIWQDWLGQKYYCVKRYHSCYFVKLGGQKNDTN